MGKEETRLLIEFNKQYNKAMVSDKDITEKEVRGLFDLWNTALATGDSKVVAGRYTKVRCGMMFVYVCISFAFVSHRHRYRRP